MKQAQFIEVDDQDESRSKHESGLRSILFLFKFAKDHLREIILGLGLILLYASATMFSGYFMGKLVGEGLVKKQWDLTVRFSILVVALEISSFLLNYYGRRILARSTSYMIFNMREKLFEILPNLPLSMLDRWPEGRIVTRITHDVESVETFFTGSLARVSSAFFLAIVSMFAMLSTDVGLGMIIISSMIPALLVVYFTREKVNRLTRAMSKYSSAINSKLSEYIDGLYLIRSFGIEKWSSDTFSNVVKNHVDKSLETNFFYAWSRPLVSFLCGLPLILLVWFGGNKVIEGSISIAVFVAFLRYSERFFMPVMMLFREIHVILQAFTNANRVANFLEFKTENEVFSNGAELPVHSISGEVEFRDVWMSYNLNSKDDEQKKWSLKNVSFKINKGEKIGIVGATGSGKTTMISVLSRLYDFEKGDVLIDNHSIKKWDIQDIRSQIGLVSQDVTLFKGTLRDNLTVNPNLSTEDIMYVAKQTGLSKVMKRNDLELESEVIDGGKNFSAGEKQIISLTRICLLSPKLLILDEATANIDPFYEKILHDGIDYLMKDHTAFIIAHRLETIHECDRLLVFDEGELVEFDTPKNLEESRGYFYRLLQSRNQANLMG